jgi:PKD repeat protein
LGSPILAQNCNAGFKFTISGCNTVVFAADSVNVNFSYTWDFGDGNSSRLANPVHSFKAIGGGTKIFTVKLTVSSSTCTASSFSRNVEVKEIPSALISDKSGMDFVNCVDGKLTIENKSTTTATNTNYKIDWGDGETPVQDLPSFAELSNTYYVRKFYRIALTVTGANGCITKDTVSFIFSATPNIGASLPSAAPICIPGDIRIIVNGVSQNTPNTKYEVLANDGSTPLKYNHPPPSELKYFFDTTACGNSSVINKETYNHAFQISITAFTGCPNQSASASVGPIRTIDIPKADFEVKPGLTACQSEDFEFENTSKRGLFWESSTDQCTSRLRARWTITPDQGFVITKGSLMDTAGLSVKFQIPRTYTVRLIVENKVNENPNNSDPDCRADTVTKTSNSRFGLKSLENEGNRIFAEKLDGKNGKSGV